MGTPALGFSLNARRRLSGGAAGPDFSLSSNTVTTDWGMEQVGTFTPIDATGPVYFVIVEDSATSADFAGFAVRNG